MKTGAQLVRNRGHVHGGEEPEQEPADHADRRRRGQGRVLRSQIAFRKEKNVSHLSRQVCRYSTSLQLSYCQ